MNYYVYILTNATGVAMYVGVTKDLVRRMYEHRQKLDPDSFTAKYNIHKLVYYECTSDVYAAIEREKQIKSWNRARKNKLVEIRNPDGKICMNRYCPRGSGLPHQSADWFTMTWLFLQEASFLERYKFERF